MSITFEIAKNTFNVETSNTVSRLYYNDKFCFKGNLFPSNFFKQFGLSTRKVNILAKNNGVINESTNIRGNVYYRYFSDSFNSMNDFVNELNSYILLNKFLN